LHEQELVVAFRVKPKIGLHELHPEVEHVRHPGIAPHGTHEDPFKYIPGLHWQTDEFVKVKLFALSQMRQVDPFVHLKHPI
jgi:hypothetical protein